MRLGVILLFIGKSMLVALYGGGDYFISHVESEAERLSVVLNEKVSPDLLELQAYFAELLENPGILEDGIAGRYRSKVVRDHHFAYRLFNGRIGHAEWCQVDIGEKYFLLVDFARSKNGPELYLDYHLRLRYFEGLFGQEDFDRRLVDDPSSAGMLSEFMRDVSAGRYSELVEGEDLRFLVN